MIEKKDILMKNISKKTWMLLVLTILFIGAICFALGYHNGKNNAEWHYRQTVFVSPSGGKYHLPTCSYIEKSLSIKPMQIDKAKDEGYTPCSRCNPDRILK